MYEEKHGMQTAYRAFSLILLSFIYVKYNSFT